MNEKECSFNSKRVDSIPLGFLFVDAAEIRKDLCSSEFMEMILL
jgi:hypothetical protein